MPALINSGVSGKIVWLGALANRSVALRSLKTDQIEATYAGLAGDDHGGLTRPSCSRVVTQYPKGTDIRNVRQLCIVSAEEMAAVAAEMGVEAFDPEWCGANMVVEGIPDFTHVPPSSRLQTQNGTTLTIDMENQPCHLPAPVIDEDAPGHGRAFKAAAKDRRGVTAWVEREGVLAVGDTVSLHIPGQRAWAPEI
ncbi:MAG: MOSC domain-containing protein [Litoreibacter sp.]|nr:MOSC domain-containing protein [Litoreibacter sp.]